MGGVAPPDVVIPVRHGDSNEELRYALRTIDAHLPHGRVWLAGFRPGWASGEVGHVPNAQRWTKHENSLRNLLAACRHPDVSEEFVLWNDDFFLLQALPGGVPTMHRGPVREFLAGYGRARSQYLSGMDATARILQGLGVEDPLCYELHVPMPMTKTGVLEAYAAATAPRAPRHPALQLRTLYGNLSGVSGERVEDVKIFKSDQPWEPGPVPFLSTMDPYWGVHPASRAIIAKHPKPCRYEREAE